SITVLSSAATQQRVDIQGRPYVGFVSEYYYPVPKCISALQIMAEESLTGAEEIDLLYASCPGDTLRLAHYRNDESFFTFFEPLFVSRLIVASHRNIRLTELHLVECAEPPKTRNCDESHEKHKKRRRHKQKKAREIRVETKKRRKQAGFEYTREGSPHSITATITVPTGESMTIAPGARLQFAPGTGIDVHGSLAIAGSEEYPVYLAAAGPTRWAGVRLRAGYDATASSLAFVNITGAEVGLFLYKDAFLPAVKSVVIDGARKGVVVETQRGDGLHLISGISATNSEDSGFTILGEGDVQFDGCLSSSNGQHGYELLTTGSISMYSSSAFSNAHDGIWLNGSRSLKVEDSLLGGNGAAGLRAMRSSSSSESFTLHLRSVNITSHFYDPAILLTTTDDMDFLLTESIIYENANGGLVFGGTTSQSQLRLVGNRWVKNSGPIVHFGLVQGGTILVDQNSFEDNRGKQQREAIIEVMSDADAESTVVISNNTFRNNQIEGGIRFEVMGGSEPKTTLSRNVFLNNHASVVVDVSALQEATVTGNQFTDPQASCELASMGDHPENNFVVDAQNTRCDLRSGSSTHRPTVTPASLIPFPPLSGTYNQIKTAAAPYSIDGDLDIPADTIVVVQPGNNLGFYGESTGLTVHGKLYINGTPSQPVELFGGDGQPWRGIRLEKGGRLFLSNVLIKDARIGALLNSDDVILNNVTFVRSLQHAVETGGDYCQGEVCMLDLGNSTIRDSFGSALMVDKRNKAVPMTIANGNFIGNAETGIEFHAPAGEITIKDVLIRDGGGNGVWLEERENSEALEAVRIERLRIEDEERGEVGLFISSQRAKKVEILDSTFDRNTVPSMVADLDMTSPVSFFNISGNRFRNSSQVITALSCVGCGSGQISRNEWTNNNADHDATALFVEFKRTEKQEKEPSILIDNNRFEANSGESSLAFSSDPTRPIAAVIYQNSFESSNNSRAVIISDTPDSSLHQNSFANPKSMFDVEVMFAPEQGRVLNATQNQWSNDPPGILDGKNNKNKGFVNLGSTPIGTTLPTLMPPIVSADCATVNYCPSLCLCEAGWSSPTCSLKVPSCALNCSNHGACVGSQCLCEPGWIGQSCEIATCNGVNDCSLHGVCVGKDKCECAEGWTGTRCDQPVCSPDSCSNGKCEGTSCKCDEGWSGPSCSFPLCSSNCSLNGVCSAPDTCSCFPDFEGDNCEKCKSDACKLCDVPCVNGHCDATGQVCVCAAGWAGSSCDVCSSAAICSVRSAILFLLPSTGDPSVPGGIVNVHAAMLPRSSGRYSCVFGSVSSIGQQVSPSLVRCPIPPSLSAGRHLFNLWPDRAATPIPHVDKRPIHFTAYSTCVSSLCQGECLGPICICPKGKTGPLCQFAHVVPSVDHQFVSEPSTTTATEEKAYVVQLPQVSSSILRLASDAPGLRLDESRSLLVWDSPRGTATAYNVTVVMSSPGGDTTFSWPLTVPVTYSAVVDRVVKEERKRRYLVEGRVVGTMSRKDVPVTVTFARSDGSEEEIEVKAEANGRFSLHWTPPGGSGEFNVIATHPGEKVDESNQGVSLRVKSTSIDYKQKVTEEELKKGIEYSLKSEGEGGKEEWTADVLYPSGNIAVESVKSTSHGVSVTYRLKRQFSGNLVVLFIRGEEKIIASHTVLPAPSNQISLTSAPSSITFNANENSRSELVRVALSSTGAPIFSPLSISFSSVPAPFELLYSEPPLEQYEQ
ncbi:hypothetical protein PMAYCL1PPCAC_26938, partial [Pristionchus mayeri]